MSVTTPWPVFITGASRGIGAATARHFAKAGHPVALLARSAAPLEALAAEIEAAGGRALAIPCDVADAAAVAASVAKTLAAFGGIGIVINNAGMLEPLGPIAEIDMREWARALAVNLNGPIYVMHATVPHLPKGGVVINITSGAAEHASFGRSAYCASKAGLMIASRVLAVEEGERRGIRAIAFSPGYVDTDMNTLNRANRMGNAGNIPVAELRPPEETARIIHFLTEPEAQDYAGKIVNARDSELRRRVGL